MKFLKFKFLIFNILILGNMFNPISFKFGNTHTYAADSTEEILENYINQEPKDKFYILGSGDFIKLEVSENLPELKRVFSINGEGYSKLPKLDLIYTKGLTIKELTKILNKEYSKFIKSPKINLTIVNYRPVRVFIDGEISSPGMYVIDGSLSLETLPKDSKDSDESSTPYELSALKDPESFNTEVVQSYKLTLNNESNFVSDKSIYFPTLVDVIRRSGGILPFADLSDIKITRINNISNGGGKIATNVNLLKTINLEDSNQNIRIMDGDFIYLKKSDNTSDNEISKLFKSNINPDFINVFVGGQVENPGMAKVSRAGTFNEALMLAGGTQVLPGKASFRRYNNDGSIDKRIFSVNKNAKRGSYKNPFLINGDMIFIGKSKIDVTSEVLKTVMSPFTSIVTAATTYKLLNGDL